MARHIVTGAAGLIVGAVLACGSGIAAGETLPSIPGARLTPVSFEDMPGWAADDHAAAFVAFRASCLAIVDDRPALAAGKTPPPAIRAICRDALALTLADAGTARRFFEARFRPLRIEPDGRSLLTGYFEPEVDGALTPSDRFPHPLFAPPDGTGPLAAGEAVGPLDGLTAARRTAGKLVALPTRAEIEAGALAGDTRPIAYVRDEVEAFTIHVQGSARIRLPDGRAVRVAFAGRNGHPYSSIGRIIVQEGHLPLEQASMDRLVAWIRANPDDGRRIMRENRSFIFFRLADELDPADGPLGAAAVQLKPGRTVATDRAIWPYGLPFFLHADLADLPAAPALPAGPAFSRLVVAQDTGAAIVGPARFDLFVGSGSEAGLAASRLRHPVTATILWPRDAR